MSRFRISAINDEADVCGVCGKSGLKRVVWLYDLDKDETPADSVPVGRDCAAILLGYGKRVKGSVAKKDINRAILDYYIQQYSKFLQTPVSVSVDTKVHKGIFRDGQVDYIFRVNGLDLEFYSLGQLSPTQDFLKQYRDHFIRMLNKQWYVETGLKTGFENQVDFPRTMRYQVPPLGTILPPLGTILPPIGRLF